VFGHIGAYEPIIQNAEKKVNMSKTFEIGFHVYIQKFYVRTQVFGEVNILFGMCKKTTKCAP
jgi:hypothetical protein